MRQEVTSESREGAREDRVPLVTLNTPRLCFRPVFWLESEPHSLLFTNYTGPFLGGPLAH